MPFAYMRANGNLLIDYIVWAQPGGAYSHDSSFTFPAVFTPIGSACGGLSQSVTGGVATTLTATLDFAVTGVPLGGVALHAIGARQLPAVIVLPFGGCLLHQSVELFAPMIVSGTGASISYPLHPNFKGFVVFGQSFALDPALTTLVASESHKSVIGGFDPHARIYNTASPSTPAGSVQIGVGIVTRLTY